MDYRVYYNGAQQIVGTGAPTTYAAGSQNNSATYYSVFTGQSAPAGQAALFAQQTGTAAAGTLGFAWHDVQIIKSGNIVTYSIDGTLIATTDLAALSTAGTNFSGSNILLVQSDINATSSTDVNADSLLFGLVDNVRVTQVEGHLEASLHLKLPASLPLHEAHAITTEVEQAIRSAEPRISDVHTHIEPLSEARVGAAPLDEEIASERDAIVAVVREVTGDEPEDLRLRQGEQGAIVALVTVLVDPASPLGDAHGVATEIESPSNHPAPVGD
jgi:hypothetical protein